MDELDKQYKLIRADFMVAKSHLIRISEEVAKASQKGIRLTKSKLVRMALDRFLSPQQEPQKKAPEAPPAHKSDQQL